MTFKMTQKVKLLTEKDFDVDKVFEVRVIDFRERGGIKQKSFSVLVKKGTKNNEYPTTEEVKDFLENKIKEV